MLSDKTRVRRVGSANLADAAAEAARVLRAGRVVAIPTETVYGVAAMPNERGREALAALKGRDPHKPIALLVADFVAAERFAAEVSPLAARLADAFCPGPLTLVLPGRGSDWVGLRAPDHPAAREVIRAAGGAVYATSANRAGQPPARTADEVLAALPDGLALVLDAGPAAIGAASTVVRVKGETYEILREGAISAARLAEAAESSPQEPL